jgi:hypothetical protein
VPVADFSTCFYDFQIAHYRDNEGYQGQWYDVDDSKQVDNYFYVTVPENDGELYFTVESYFHAMFPYDCAIASDYYDREGYNYWSLWPIIYFRVTNDRTGEAQF